jgi:hypothetical protein
VLGVDRGHGGGGGEQRREGGGAGEHHGADARVVRRAVV